MNVVRHMIIDSLICDRCQHSPESVFHGLWSCREVDIVGQMWSYGVFGQENRSDVGVVIQNREGLVLASQSQQLHLAYSPSEIEALAAHRDP
uniref:Uncharacterized protein n=1 Tax=Quercus lobata TaxID=97700 RepID=A0A7N2MBL1_QUELO